MDAAASVAELGARVLKGGRLDRPAALRLAEDGRHNPHELLYWAHRVRQRHFSTMVRFCAIVPGKSGGCSEDCRWCAQSARHAACDPATSRTALACIVSAARTASANHAAGLGIVNSGRRPTDRDMDAVVQAAGEISHQDIADLGLCASLGELTDAHARRLAEAGFRHYTHNLETSRRMFPQMVSTHSYDDRLRTLQAARNAGLRLCCGGIFGLGESWADRVDLALTLRDEVRPAVVPLNFLHPITGTPLENAAPLTPMEILCIIAVFRLVLPTVDLKIAGGREVNLRDLQSWMFYAGATSCLIGNYLTTCGRPADEDLRMIEDLGLTIVRRFPDSDAASSSTSASESPDHCSQ